MQITLYGIPNCDQIKKARAWLAEHHIDHQFHDYKKSGIDPQTLTRWFALMPWEQLLNRKGTTWRKLDDSTQKAASDSQAAMTLMCASPSVIKRPVLQCQFDKRPTQLLVGFEASSYEAFFKRQEV